jgi:hypothetical protein
MQLRYFLKKIQRFGGKYLMLEATQNFEQFFNMFIIHPRRRRIHIIHNFP